MRGSTANGIFSRQNGWAMAIMAIMTTAMDGMGSESGKLCNYTAARVVNLTPLSLLLDAWWRVR